jgi:tetratricopeptide (TPR) repeat protein
MRALCVAIAVLVAGAELRADDTTTVRHLLLGVRAFKAERYDEALVELRLVARRPDAPADLAFYLGPTLYKLGRHDEALAVFAGSRAAPDALTDFYRGQTYYQVRLYRKARAVFAALRARGLGPALDDAAGRYIAAVDAAYQVPPTSGAVDHYLAQGLERAVASPAVAAEYLDEARQVELLAPQHHRRGEIWSALAAAWNATGRSRAVVELLAGELSLPDEASWQLARAHAALGDAARARPMLEAIAGAGGPRAADAVALLATLR